MALKAPVSRQNAGAIATNDAYLAFQHPVGSKLKLRVGLLNAPDKTTQTASCATDQLSCRMALKAPAASLEARSSRALNGEPGAAAATAAGRARPAGLVTKVPFCPSVAAAAAAAALLARVPIVLHDVQDALDQVRARATRGGHMRRSGAHGGILW